MLRHVSATLPGIGGSRPGYDPSLVSSSPVWDQLVRLADAAKWITVAVGTTIAGRRPHRSVSARLRIRLLLMMNNVEALIGIWMQNTRLQNPYARASSPEKDLQLRAPLPDNERVDQELFYSAMEFHLEAVR